MANRLLEAGVYGTGRGLIGLCARAMLDLDVTWHVPLPDGPKIICSNHPTTTDPFVLLSLLPERAHLLITQMCFDIPGLGRALRLSGHVPVVDGNGRAAFEAVRRLLEEGETVAIYPEGALSPLEGGFARAHTGAARLALLTGAPIVPVGVALDRERIRLAEMTVGDKTETARWYLRGPYAITVGGSMRVAGDVEDRALVRATTEVLMARIARLERASAARLPARQPRLAERVVRGATAWRPRVSLELPGLADAALRGVGSPFMRKERVRVRAC